MEFKKVKTALIGCGMISKTYLTNLKALDVIDLVVGALGPELLDAAGVPINVFHREEGDGGGAAVIQRDVDDVLQYRTMQLPREVCLYGR